MSVTVLLVIIAIAILVAIIVLFALVNNNDLKRLEINIWKLFSIRIVMDKRNESNNKKREDSAMSSQHEL